MYLPVPASGGNSMGSAKNRFPRQIRSSGSARPPVPGRLPPYRTSDMTSSTIPRLLEVPAGGDAKISSLRVVAPGVRPLGQQPKLIDCLSEALRARHYSPRTEQRYQHWVSRTQDVGGLPEMAGELGD